MTTTSNVTSTRRVSKARALLMGSVSIFAFAAQGALAQDNGGQIDELIVKTDPVGLMEEKQSGSVFGIDRPLVETPRSISIVSDTTMERYGIQDIDDFITTTPGTFGGSFFGVPGAISIRGRLSDNYFRGFKRVTNNGFFPLPIGASSKVEIIRGPTPAIYGAGRIGGLLNMQPKTTRAAGLTADDGMNGSVSYTGGKYDKNNVTAELNLPFLVGGRETGISFYGEYEDSKDFVRGREPEHKLIQLGVNHDLSNGFSVEFGGMYFDSEGYNQTAGWNRLTQELIDNGTYITGRDTDLVDLDGNGRVTHNEANAATSAALGVFPIAGETAGEFFGVSCLSSFVEFFAPAQFFLGCGFGQFFPGTAFDLDTGVGTAQISPRDQLISPFDVAEAENFTLYFDLIKEFDNGSTAKLQFFYDDNNAKQGTAHGFAGQHIMDVFEVRGSYEFKKELTDFANVDVFVTASHRRYDSLLRENFLSGFVVVDRLDLSVGSFGNDVFDTPFTVEPGGVTCGLDVVVTCNAPWDTQMDSLWTDTGAAIVTDIHLWENLGILFNGRYDQYHFEAIDNGTITFGAPLGVLAEDNKGGFSFSVSGSYNFDGIVPYVTYAEGNDPLINSNGGVSVGTIMGNDGALADSELIEAGVKFDLLDGTLSGAVSVYKQERVDLDIIGSRLNEETRGIEAEFNWVATDNWAVTGTGTLMDVEIKDPDPLNCPGGTFFGAGAGEFVNVAPTDPIFFGGIPSTSGFGGIFRALNASCLPELQDGYDKEGIPEKVFSLFVTYTSDETDYGTFGATFGGTYVGTTGTLPVADEVRFPDYTTFRLAAFAEYKNFSVVGSIENLFDKEYFISSQGTFQNVTVHPGTGRIWTLQGKVSF